MGQLRPRGAGWFLGSDYAPPMKRRAKGKPAGREDSVGVGKRLRGRSRLITHGDRFLALNSNEH